LQDRAGHRDHKVLQEVLDQVVHVVLKVSVLKEIKVPAV
jgi:hypothetical protein